MTQRRWRKRSFSPDVLMEIARMAGMRISAAEITRQLERNERFAGHIPRERTVQEIVRELDPRDDSGIWSVADAEPDDARLILPVLAAVVVESKGKVSSLSKGVAHWVAKLRQAVPLLSPADAYFLARLYHRYQGESTYHRQALDIHLAMKTWEGPGPANFEGNINDTFLPFWFPEMEARS